jgi:hypothetical protein
MNRLVDRLDPAPNNPFATRFVRPGALPYVFPPGVDACRLVQHLRGNRWWGQIIGPHGHGKSTLLQTLLPELRASGRDARLIVMRGHERAGKITRLNPLRVLRVERLPGTQQATPWTETTQVIVDGYEQMSWSARLRLRRHCRKHRAGLLVTSHKSMGMPLVWETMTSPSLAERLARRLLQSADYADITANDVLEAFHRNRGDLRETWFHLYDIYESRVRRAALTETAQTTASDSVPCGEQ